MRGIFCLIVGLAMAAVLCQEPEFLQQYCQRLDGAIGILQEQADAFDADAQALSLTRDQALDRLSTTPEPGVVADGNKRQGAFVRLGTLVRDRAELAEPEPFHRFATLVRHLDRPIAQATLSRFVPAAPLSEDGLLFGASGFLIGFLLGGALLGGIGLLAGSRRGIRYRAKPTHRIRF